MKSVVSEKRQVTIPKPLHEKLGLRPGQVREFETRDGVLVGARRLPMRTLSMQFGDTSVLLDVFSASTRFGEASRALLIHAFSDGSLVACDVV